MDSRNMDGNGRQLAGAGYLPPLPPGNGLARQQSIYSLTFDEIQSTLGSLGKDFGSMNMDEFIKNIWSAEEAQMMACAAGTSLPETTGTGTGLIRQGSLTMPVTLSQKTVDEVWKDLYRESVGNQGPDVVNLQPQQRQVTLEEFLLKVGVVREEIPASQGTMTAGANSSSNTPMVFGDTTGRTNPASSAGIFLGFDPASRSNGGAVLPLPIQSNLATGIAGNEMWPSYPPPFKLVNGSESGKQHDMHGGVVGIGDSIMNNRITSAGVGLGTSTVSVATAPSPVNPLSCDNFADSNRGLSSLSPVPYPFDKVSGKRGSAKEKAVERRQKRMIKNRESAARSRARKQAYTVDLEEEVAKLKEQNHELQKKQGILEEEKNQVLEMLNQQSGNKKRCLRRTQTGPW